MTWSIVARDPATGAFGVAVTTKFFAVGALCPYGRSGVGAIATQALVNPLYGSRGLKLLKAGVPAPEVVRLLTEADAGRGLRQVHVIDAEGRIGAFTGGDCIGWCGHVVRDTFSVAGNMLAGESVVTATADRFAAMADRPFAERFLLALDAGQAEGGDKRGRQSAAIKIYSTEEYPDLDIRVDDHPDPLIELRRLYDLSQTRFAAFRQFMATRDNPAGVWDRAVIEAEVQRREAALLAKGA